MAYVENVFEEYVDGDESIALRNQLSRYKEEATKHRQLCDLLRQQKNVTTTSISSENLLCDYYRRQGHLSVNLGLFDDARGNFQPPEYAGQLTANFAGMVKTMSIQQWIDKLELIYANDIGFEFMYASADEQQWFQQLLESESEVITTEELEKAYSDIARAEALEKHLGIQFVGQKRFSLEGLEALIPCLERVICTQVDAGYNDFVIGMAHRGRLNTLVNVLGVSVETLMAEFEGTNRIEETSGDVKYHLGHSTDRTYNQKDFHIALAYNPSHLEAINAVVMGNVRARIDRRETNPCGIIVHGDASIAGQGVVMENLTMSQVPAYHIGGVIHVVANNQIGFTTLPRDGRSTPYCTDIAKMISAPVMHVRADNLPAVVKCAKIAAMYRDKFKKDVFIDLIGHRKYGHNEADEPRATQPLMYQKISQMGSISEHCLKQVVSHGVSQKNCEMVYKDIQSRIKAKHCLIDCSDLTNSSRHKDWVRLSKDHWDSDYQYNISFDDLSQHAKSLMETPKGIKLQRQVENLVKQRSEMANNTQPLNWGMAELLAYQTIMRLGYPVRLVGQDAIRGTFSHRQASVYDQETGERHSLPKPTSKTFFENYNTVLSEYAALGFEYGYAETSPNTLVVFEAQFGDFINGAQIIIDQFISSGYQKWKRYCGLVMLLPHGYEGQGPEHSSARMERFLQLCAEENMQVCVPSTPKQIYQLLLRQVLRQYRSPLIVFSPKSLLRHPKAVSSLASLSSSPYELAIADQDRYHQAKNLVLCSGKVFYDLDQYREQVQAKNVAIVRLEQLHPFPNDEITRQLKYYKNVKTVIWCQEEPENQGAWEFVRKRLVAIMPELNLVVAARNPSAASAVGYLSKHREQQTELMKKVFTGRE